jgi:hypothetical protein
MIPRKQELNRLALFHLPAPARSFWKNQIQQGAGSLAIIVDGGLPVATALAELARNPPSGPIHLHDVDFPATGADAFDLGLAKALELQRPVMIVVGILQDDSILLPGSIERSHFHFDLLCSGGPS